LRIIPEVGQVSENSVDSSNKESADVFHEDDSGLYLANDAGILEPKARSVAFDDSCSISGNGDILARESSRDAIHRSTPSCAVEGSNVRPDRRFVQRPFFNPCSQNFCVLNSDLDITDCSSRWASELKSEIESRSSGKQADGTYSHTMIAPF
jgi:hypothetical protein